MKGILQNLPSAVKTVFLVTHEVNIDRETGLVLDYGEAGVVEANVNDWGDFCELMGRGRVHIKKFEL